MRALCLLALSCGLCASPLPAQGTLMLAASQSSAPSKGVPTLVVVVLIGLAKDYEHKPTSSRAALLWAMSHFMLKRL